VTTTNNSAVEVAALAEAAEAEADAAEAHAAAARARARAIQLRQQANAADAADTAEPELEPAEATGPTEDTESEAPSPVAAVSTRRRWSPRREWTAVGICLVVVVVIVGLLGASGYMTWKHRVAVSDRQHRAEFVAAARQSFVTLTTMDFNHAKEDVQRVIDNSTGPFKTDFQSQAADFIKTVEQSKVVTKGTVSAAAVESMTGDSAVVLVAATSQVTNAAGAQQEPRAWRVSVTMTRDSGQIKMSKVEFVP
jgi:Mce-associated membrane protein